MDGLIAREDIQPLFERLGVRDFSAALPEGQISWLDEQGAVVAHARCAAVISWAPDESVHWADALPHFEQAGVPTLARPEGLPEHQESVSKSAAEQLAARAAQGTPTEFLYTAPSGAGAMVLAISRFTPSPLENDLADPARREAATREWAALKLRRLASYVSTGASDGPALLRALAEETTQQAQYTVAGTPLADALRTVADQAAGWADALPDDAAAVGEALAAASRQLATSKP